MKKLLLTIGLMLLTVLALGQSAKIGKYDVLTTNNPAIDSIGVDKELDLQTTTGLYLPSGTTAEQPVPVRDGMFRYNSDLGTAELFAEGVWGPVGGGGASIGDWIASTPYEIGEFVVEDGKLYRALTDHTSGVDFSVDLGNGDWEIISEAMYTSSGAGDRVIPVYDGASGLVLTGSPISIDVSANIDGIASLTMSGPLTIDSSFTGPLRADAGEVSQAAIALDSTDTSGILPLSKGGTGSGSQNFVDLTTTQTVAGAKTFSNNMILSSAFNVTGTATFNTGLTGIAKLTAGVLSAGTVDLTANVTDVLPIANGGTGSSSKNFVDLTTTQTVAGAKTFSGAVSAASLVMGGTKAASAVLDVQSTTQGVLPPRMTNAEMIAIASPATGLTVYNTTYSSLATYNGAVWTYGFGNLAVISDWIDVSSPSALFVNFGTISNAKMKYRQIGDSIQVLVAFTMTTPVASTAYVTLPNSYTLKTALLNEHASSGTGIVGDWRTNGASTLGTMLSASGSSTTAVYLGGSYNSANMFNGITSSSTIGSGAQFQASFTVPVNQLSSNTSAWVQANSTPASTMEIFSLRSDNAGVVSRETADFVNGNAVITGTSVYTFTFTSGFFGSDIPNCFAVIGEDDARYIPVYNESTTSVTVKIYTSSVAQVISPFKLMCQRTGANLLAAHSPFILGTFAGIANYSGYTGRVEDFRIQYGAGSNTACTAASTNCAYASKIGTGASNVFHLAGTGDYRLDTVRTYTSLMCTLTASEPGVGIAVLGGSTTMECTNCNSLTFKTVNHVPTSVNSNGQLHCTGTY